MTCVEYLCGAIKNVYSILEGYKAALKSFRDVHHTYTLYYRPELGVTNELYAELINLFQKLIGVLTWLIKLGMIYIMTEVSFSSQRLCLPREGHLNVVYTIFRYLQKNLSNNTVRIAFDPSYAHTYDKVFEVSTI